MVALSLLREETYSTNCCFSSSDRFTSGSADAVLVLSRALIYSYFYFRIETTSTATEGPSFHTDTNLPCRGNSYSIRVGLVLKEGKGKYKCNVEV